MNWYYVRGGQRQGPVDEDTLRSLIAAGSLKAHDLVWNETMGDQWAAASSVPGLFTPPVLAGPVPSSALVAPAPVVSGVAGQTPNKELMARARASLQGQWGTGVAVSAIYLGISFAIGLIPYGGFLAYLIAGPLYLGFTLLFLSVIRARGEVGQLFAGFQQFGRATGTYLLTILFVLLWMLLLIIPGIIMSYAYMMAFYVLADHPGITPLEALRRSKEMMRGHKWKLFCLQFRFIGWALLAMLTCGIGYLWLLPYIQAATSHFYEDVRPRGDVA